MPVMILDPEMERNIRLARDCSDTNRRDEVWEGVLVVPAVPNNEHQIMVMDLCYAFSFVINRSGGDHVMPGANVSDRDADWKENYRCPDAVVYLATNKAKNSDTHWVGGPDLAVEIVSRGEDPRQKLDFYAKINTREVLIVDRYPWVVELYQLQNGKLELAGKSDAANTAVLKCIALPLTFQLQPGTPRPVIRVAHTASGQTWTA
ncbi:MAG TPA: Uma2 family endonuclease [Gemmata sp.]|nr:Uma2 family endonuclease [Gemmata sp.]